MLPKRSQHWALTEILGVCSSVGSVNCSECSVLTPSCSVNSVLCSGCVLAEEQCLELDMFRIQLWIQFLGWGKVPSVWDRTVLEKTSDPRYDLPVSDSVELT